MTQNYGIFQGTYVISNFLCSFQWKSFIIFFNSLELFEKLNPSIIMSVIISDKIL
jgi:hypothetical protein